MPGKCFIFPIQCHGPILHLPTASWLCSSSWNDVQMTTARRTSPTRSGSVPLPIRQFCFGDFRVDILGMKAKQKSGREQTRLAKHAVMINGISQCVPCEGSATPFANAQNWKASFHASRWRFSSWREQFCLSADSFSAPHNMGPSSVALPSAICVVLLLPSFGHGEPFSTCLRNVCRIVEHGSLRE